MVYWIYSSLKSTDRTHLRSIIEGSYTCNTITLEIHLSSKIFITTLIWTQLIQLKIRIPGEKKAQLLRELDEVGINQAFIYPDLSNTAQYLTDSHLHDDLN